MTLFINACVGHHSRTARIAYAFLADRTDVTEIRLDQEYLEPLDAGMLQRRNQCLWQKNFSHSYFDLARQFAQADEIVIAAPFWDLSFPAKLRTYLENICIAGVTFRYTDEGTPVGLCKAKKLTYITTAGGHYQPAFSYDYIQTLARDFFGIAETELIYAENLDIAGNDPAYLVDECIRRSCPQYHRPGA